MVIRQEVTAPSPNIVQHFFHSLFNTVTCYLEKFRILHFWIQTAQLPSCFVYFYTFHTGVRNCVSSYCLESKLTYNIQHTVTPTGMETCKNYAKKCKPYKRRVSEMSACNNIFCSTWKGLQFTAQPEDFILLLQVCLYFICSLPFALSLSQVDFEVTIPGEGKDRIFKVSIRWLAKVSWRLLQETLVSGRLQVPLDSVQALDVAMRHLASMRSSISKFLL